jgi:chromate transporter
MRHPQSQDADPRPSLAHLFTSFLKLGTTAFGGPAMVAYIRRMAVEQKGWLDEASFREGVALCQTIPGATAMQTSAYVGLRAGGVPGAIASFVGFGLPAFCIMMTLSALYARRHSLPAVVSAFSGLRAIIVVIVANAAISFGRTSLKGWRDVGIAAVAAGMFRLGMNPVWVILLAALLGLVLCREQLSPPGATDSATRSHSIRPLLLLLLATAVGLGFLVVANRKLFDLAALMCRIDLLAFGGGFASIPLMLREIVDVRSWMDRTTFMDGIVMGQITPGPIVITATFVGYWLQGPLGAFVATVAIFAPSFLLVVAVVPYFDRLRESARFNRAITGILCSFVGLLLSVTISFGSNVAWDVRHVFYAGAAFAALLLGARVTWVVLIGTALSVFTL